MTSSRYTMQLCHLTPDRIMSSARWNVAGALVSPNGIRL